MAQIQAQFVLIVARGPIIYFTSLRSIFREQVNSIFQITVQIHYIGTLLKLQKTAEIRFRSKTIIKSKRVCTKRIQQQDIKLHIVTRTHLEN